MYENRKKKYMSRALKELYERGMMLYDEGRKELIEEVLEGTSEKKDD